MNGVLIWIQVASCFYMTGVIWVIQLIHYPSFAWIESAQFERFHLKHTQAMGLIAAPGMGIELASAAGLAFYSAPALDFSPQVWIINLASVIALWGATFLISVPLHNQLSRGKNQDGIRRLVSTNWIRTALWTVRSVFLLLLMLRPHGN